METMSKEAHLSKIYSNHCLRGSNASVLDDPTLQNSMLLIKTKLVSNGQVFPKIVPKPPTSTICTSTSVSVIPCVPLSTSVPQQSVHNVHVTSPVNTNPLIITSWPGQVQTSPLNTPLQSIASNAVPHNSLPMQATPLLPTVVSVYGSFPSVRTGRYNQDTAQS